MNIGFTKMHGLGNDFVVIDNMNGRISLSREQIVFLCDRHKGIGADGVILVEPSDKGDCFMNYINADGSEAQMCGNGVRCVAKFLRDILKIKNDVLKIDTRSGLKEIKCNADGTFSVNMGQASLFHPDFPKKPMYIEELSLNFIAAGNPFAVSFVDDLSKYDFLSMGPRVENHKNFSHRMNFELAEERNKNHFKVRVWERGCGETLACGSGATALYALAKRQGKVDGEVVVEFPGGELFFSSPEGEDIIMRGPAEEVFSSIIEI
jgi:diaminopimelate epimerase